MQNIEETNKKTSCKVVGNKKQNRDRATSRHHDSSNTTRYADSVGRLADLNGTIHDSLTNFIKKSEHNAIDGIIQRYGINWIAKKTNA